MAINFLPNKILFKTNIKQVAQRIAHLSPMYQGQISFKKKHINGPWKPEARNRTHPSFYACLITSNFDDDLIKNEQGGMETPFSHYTWAVREVRVIWS